jgi:hypothetical protein
MTGGGNEESDPSDSPIGTTPPGDWIVWNDETGGPATWVYRPDVFDAERFPAACIPTLHVTNRGSERRPPGRGGGAWRARLTLEPEIELDRSPGCPTRTSALERAAALARAFTSGEYDLRAAYHDPSDREAYLGRLSRALSASEDRSEN